MSEDTINETGICMLPVLCLKSMAVVHVGCVEMKDPCSCGIDRQIHCSNNPDVLIAISCERLKSQGNGNNRTAKHCLP